MSVLSQAPGNASHSHKLEFMIRSTEELSALMEELKACDSGATLQHSATRSVHISYKTDTFRPGSVWTATRFLGFYL